MSRSAANSSFAGAESAPHRERRGTIFLGGGDPNVVAVASSSGQVHAGLGVALYFEHSGAPVKR